MNMHTDRTQAAHKRSHAPRSWTRAHVPDPHLQLHPPAPAWPTLLTLLPASAPLWLLRATAGLGSAPGGLSPSGLWLNTEGTAPRVERLPCQGGANLRLPSPALKWGAREVAGAGLLCSAGARVRRPRRAGAGVACKGNGRGQAGVS